jgi:ubiquinone/menaquinone biosynthesis C-methylase UbiE
LVEVLRIFGARLNYSSGTWILDVAKIVPPDTTLYGIDIESRLFPFVVRQNIHFFVKTVTALPSYWTNTFQLINQRLLVAALTSSQWVTALAELKRILAPGGVLQLGEVGF